MKNFFILCCLWIACCAISAQEPCPQVIPALQQWKGGSGKLALPAEGNIVVNPADEAVLLSTAEILADDLSMMMGWNYSVKIGKPGKNDIYMPGLSFDHSYVKCSSTPRINMKKKRKKLSLLVVAIERSPMKTSAILHSI